MKLNTHPLKDGGFKSGAESTDTGHQPRQLRRIPDRRIRIVTDGKCVWLFCFPSEELLISHISDREKKELINLSVWKTEVLTLIETNKEKSLQKPALSVFRSDVFPGVCLWSAEGFPFPIRDSGIYGKNPNNTVTIFYNDDDIEQELIFCSERHRSPPQVLCESETYIIFPSSMTKSDVIQNALFMP